MPHVDVAPSAAADPKRILIVRLSHLGDVIHALPAFWAARRRWPRAELGWVVETQFAPLLEGLPGLDRRFEFDRRGGARAWWHLGRAFGGWRPDLAIDVQGNAKSAAAALVSRARLRVGLARSDWREPFAAWSLHAAAPHSPGGHAVDRVRHLAAWAVGADSVEACFELGLSQPERDAGRECLRALLGAAARPALLQLGRPGDPRSLDRARSSALIRAFEDAGRPLLVLSGPLERELGRELAALHPARPGLRAHLPECPPLRASAALMAAVAEREGVFVGADSGPLHLAVASGLRTVCLAGPQDPERTGPWPPGSRPGSRQVAVRARRPPPCAPCLARRCVHPDGPVCMTGIAVEDVLSAAR